MTVANRTTRFLTQGLLLILNALKLKTSTSPTEASTGQSHIPHPSAASRQLGHAGDPNWSWYWC